MAAPNIVQVSSLYGKTVGAALGTTLTTDILTCPADKLIKVNTIIVSNVDGAADVDVSVSFYDSSATTQYRLTSTIAVPADSTLVVVNKENPIYLEESDTIRAGASVSGDAEIIISYDEYDDA
jgi:hypothetical protein